MTRDRLVSAVLCSLPANGHSNIYLGRCAHLTTGELQRLAAHLTDGDTSCASLAMVYPLGREVDDTTVRQIQHSDHLCIVWRRCRPTTFFFTRKGQLNTEHLRVRIVRMSECYLSGERMSDA